MASQFSQFEAGISVHFVVPKKYNDENDCNEDMWEAFQKCQDNEISPVWLKEHRCTSLKPEKTDIFVFEEFEGEAFEKLKSTECLIIGAKCLLRCFLANESVPEGPHPVFTTAMRDLVVCFSGFSPEEKKSLQTFVEYMGGLCLPQLRMCVTHLVTDSVMSAKYEMAVEKGIKLYRKEWITTAWELNLKDFKPATDSHFDQFEVPVFMNLVVTSTNLNKSEKEELKKLIVKNGGEFMGPLDGTRVKVVIAKEYSSLSDKIKYAMKNCIPVVTIDWVRKSVESGHALSMSDYLISPRQSAKCSTPEKTSQTLASLDISTISCIRGDVTPNGPIDETMSATAMSSTTLSSTRSTPTDKPLSGASEKPLSGYAAIVDRLSLKDAKRAGPFLDGCNIYLSGFSPTHRDRVNKILNIGSATRYDEISDTLTHVIVGDHTKAAPDLKAMQAKGLQLPLLSLQWLEESVKLKRPAPEENYLFNQKDEAPRQEPPSPLSKKNLQMLQKPKRPPVPAFNLDKDKEPDDEPDLMRHYLQPTAPPEKMLSVLPNTSSGSSSKPSNSTISKSTESPKPNPDSSEIALSQPSTMSTQLFRGLTFFVEGFEEGPDIETIRENITGLGGRLVARNFRGIPDFAVVPVTGTLLKTTANEIVTSLFIDDCLDHDAVVEIQYYHRPICIPEAVKPLEDCVIVVSSYAGTERSYLSMLAMALGARHQDILARRTNLEKKLYGGTHLICTLPEGNKYNAAVKWKLPAVTAEWLKACAEKLRLVDETPYLVGETMAPERNNSSTPKAGQMAAPMAPPNLHRQVLTPKRQLNQSPVPNGSSPFHVATPQTPYGQIFGADPSPNTRKAWKKWIDDFPEADGTPEEQAAKRRRLSTPASEVKRQVWDALVNAGPKPDANARTLHSDSLQQGGGEEDEMQGENPVVRKELSFNDHDETTEKLAELHPELDEMEKLLKTNSSSSNEGRFSIHNDEREKIVDHRHRPATQAESVGWEEPTRQALKTAVKNHIVPTVTEETELQEDLTEHREMGAENGVELDDDDDDDDFQKKPAENSRKVIKKRKFMLSGIRDRQQYEECIRTLGGDVSTEAVFDESATHLLSVRPSRNEKMLGSIASGKWILHSSYLRACEEAGQFLDEEPYEWGNPRSEGVIPVIEDENERTIAAAAHRWRLKLNNDSSSGPLTEGAFEGMVAMLMVSKEKYDMFERLIKAGGGEVVQAKPPYDLTPSRRKINHCFIASRTGQQIDWAMLASKGILCFQPQYLNLLLTTTETIKPREHVLPEFKKYLALLPK